MIADRRTLTYIAIALIVGAALALAVALSQGEKTAATSGPEGQVSAATQPVVLGSDEGAADVAPADPARTEPLLDQFVAKDPFIPLVSSGGGSGGSSTPSPSPSSTPAASYSAKVKVDDSTYTVEEGDKVPSGSPAFKISGITSGDVTFAVIDGTLENGDSSVTVNLGESVSVTLENGDSYDLSVVSIGEGGGGGGGGDTDGHSISVLSITSSNGVAMATIEVDGKTYADLEVGDTVDTSWGEISIIAINVSAQTVTVMHGDQTLVLHAGQVVVK